MILDRFRMMYVCFEKVHDVVLLGLKDEHFVVVEVDWVELLLHTPLLSNYVGFDH